ncbi:MAG: asparaginase AnsZ [Elainellaceae cyanobacterium]
MFDRIPGACMTTFCLALSLPLAFTISDIAKANHNPDAEYRVQETYPEDRPNIAHVNVGGTITSRAPTALTYFDYGEHGQFSPQEIIGLVPEIGNIAEIQVVNEEPIAQTDMPLAAATVMQAASDPEVDGVVVTSGTWALEELAYFLHLTVNTEKPVVVVGSQRPPNTYSSDAASNYFNAVRLAADPQSAGMGVLVLLNEEINSAREVTKGAIYRLQTFESREFGPLGSTDPDQIAFYRAPMRRHTYMSEFDVTGHTSLSELPRVDIIYGCRGCDDALVRASVEAGSQGIIVAAMGDGWLPEIEDALREAAEAGVVVVRSSRAGENRVMPWYRYEDLFVSGDNLLPQKARILLMLALMETNDVSEIQRMFNEY